MSKADILLGLQWGDEGKGKVVDVLTPSYGVIARFQGGPNAGHTLHFDGKKHVLHTIPSGIFRPGTVNIIGNGVVIDPVIFAGEVNALNDRNVPLGKLVISRKAHLILPTHRLLDAASEALKGKKKIGSTLKGIGPAYMDKTGRNGLRVGDLDKPDFQVSYGHLRDKHLSMLRRMNFPIDSLGEMEQEFLSSLEKLASFQHADSEHMLNGYLDEGISLLAEGAQGSMLDIDFGSYPFVTSSTTTCAGACTGLGIAPGRVGQVFGIFKAYCTRVGSGPFPTELQDETGERLREKGNEFGATTGRPRRCGWIDLVALKYAIMLNGVTQLIMMKADVLSGLDSIKACTHYEQDGRKSANFPFDISSDLVKPVYKAFPGWQEDISSLRNYERLPESLVQYIGFLEDYLQTPVAMVSVGPDREQTIERNTVEQPAANS